MYMQVETRTGSLLHLKRSPGIRSWSLLVGILSIGLAAAYYSGDNIGWKFFYVTGCLFVAVQNLEDWEEALFDKTTGKVILKTFNLYKKILMASRVCHEQENQLKGIRIWRTLNAMLKLPLGFLLSIKNLEAGGRERDDMAH
uniref:Essential for reactive oxygen species protein n=1 Tax=Sarcophilus harrisii TaxID=9305 RepID=A0A7N4NKF8_SARHA